MLKFTQFFPETIISHRSHRPQAFQSQELKQISPQRTKYRTLRFKSQNNM